jgi:AhpD family alkylhydroperoxidase
MIRIVSSSFISLVAGIALATLPHAIAGDTGMPATDQTYKEIQQMFGTVPSFAEKFPKAGLAGAWAELRDLELSDKTALPVKTKVLISLAVAAQIPCQYCIYADTEAAKRAGASQEEIAEAVGMAALTRHWSTIFNGLQIDFETFKKEMAGG